MNIADIMKEYGKLEPEFQVMIRTKAVERLQKYTFKGISNSEINYTIAKLYKDYCGFKNLIDDEIEAVYTRHYAGI